MYEQQTPKRKTFFNILTKVGLLIFVLLAAVTILSLLGIPKQLRIFVVETGSMEPNVPTGSLIFDIPQNSYNIGDIITFNQPSEIAGAKATPITHRINSKKADGEIETKGDNNKTADVITISQSNIIGKTVFHIPFIGLIINFAKTQLGFLILIIIPSIILIYSEVLNMKKEILKMQKKKKSDVNNSNYEQTWLKNSL